MSPDELELVAWLTRSMRSRRLTARGLAARAGLDNSTLSRLLRGESRASLTTLRRLAEALGEDPPFLVHAPARTQTERVFEALAGDAALSPTNRDRVMRFYLRLRRDVERRDTEETRPH